MDRLYIGLKVNVKVGSDGRPYINPGIVNKFLVNFDIPLIQFYALKRKEALTYEDLIDLANKKIALNPEQAKNFNDHFNGLTVKQAYGTACHYKFKQLSKNNAYNTIIKFKNQQISMKEYFLICYELNLRFPHLQLMELHRFPHPVPIELFKISMSAQKVRKVLTESMRKFICTLATLDPESHFNKTKEMTKMAIFTNNNHVDSFGIQNEDLKALEIEARVLPEPQCVYTEENPLEKVILDPAEPTLIIPCAANLRTFVYQDLFIQKLANIGSEKGMEFKNTNRNLKCTNKTFESFEDVHEFIQETKYQNENNPYHHSILFVFILGENSDKLYSWIKFCGDVLEGVPTQCVNAKNLGEMWKNESELNSMIRGIVAKTTDKLGGTMNQIYDEEFKSECNKTFVKYTTNENPTMFLGIFATTPVKKKNVGQSKKDKDGQSTSKKENDGQTKKILSLSFNIDAKATKFCHKFDVVKDENDFIEEELCALFEKALFSFKQKLNRLPAKVLIYRCGLTDNVAEYVAEHEVEMFNKAWNSCVKQIGSSDGCPGLVYLFIDRTHKTRFMKILNDGESSQDLNMEKGTVVDDYITSSNQFFLCSHKTKKGSTLKPACYKIYHNSLAISPNDLQLLTYALCFLVQRSVHSVSVPAPLHYVRLVCDRVMTYLQSNENTLEGLHHKMAYTNFIA